MQFSGGREFQAEEQQRPERGDQHDVFLKEASVAGE